MCFSWTDLYTSIGPFVKSSGTRLAFWSVASARPDTDSRRCRRASRLHGSDGITTVGAPRHHSLPRLPIPHTAHRFGSLLGSFFGRGRRGFRPLPSCQPSRLLLRLECHLPVLTHFVSLRLVGVAAHQVYFTAPSCRAKDAHSPWTYSNVLYLASGKRGASPRYLRIVASIPGA